MKQKTKRRLALVAAVLLAIAILLGVNWIKPHQEKQEMAPLQTTTSPRQETGRGKPNLDKPAKFEAYEQQKAQEETSEGLIVLWTPRIGVVIDQDENTVFVGGFIDSDDLLTPFHFLKSGDSIWVNTTHKEEDFNLAFIMQDNKLSPVAYSASTDNEICPWMRIQTEVAIKYDWELVAWTSEYSLNQLQKEIANISWEEKNTSHKKSFSGEFERLPFGICLRLTPDKLKNPDKIIIVETGEETRYYLESQGTKWLVQPDAPLDAKGSFKATNCSEIQFGTVTVELGWKFQLDSWGKEKEEVSISDWEDCIGKTPEQIFAMLREKRG